MKAAAKLFLIPVWALILSASGALAQSAAPEPHIDTVTVTGQRQKDEAAARHFAETFLKPAPTLDGQYAAWWVNICPRVVGLDPGAQVFVEERIKEIAARVGAPVDRNDPCIANMGVIFTSDPQATLDFIRAHRPELVIGLNHVLKVSYPIQPWYATVTKDYSGVLTLDQAWEDSGREGPRSTAANDTRLHTGLSSQIGAVTILVDIKAATGRTLGAIADYLALMTLSQNQPTERCQQIPSIANLMAADCPAGTMTDSISGMDIALLTGLYQSRGAPEKVQRQSIIKAMANALEAQDGK